MSIKIINCYYHEDTPAVAICAQCGVGICRYCAVEDDFGRIICYKCGNSNLKQEHKKYREILKQQGGRFRNGAEFIVPGIIGILIVVVTGLITYFSGEFNTIHIEEVISFIIIGYMLFSIPFCIIMLNGRFAPRYDTWHDRFFKWYLKAMLSFFIGWIVFTFYLIRFIVSKIKPKNSNNIN